MLRVVFSTVLVSAALAAVPATRTEAVWAENIGATLQFEHGEILLPSSADMEEAKFSNGITQLWEQHTPIAIYSATTFDKQGAEAGFSTWLDAPTIAVDQGTDGKELLKFVSPSKAAQTLMVAAPLGTLTVSAESVQEGYNCSAVVHVADKAAGVEKEILSLPIDGAVAGLSVSKDGSHFAVIANVDNSYIVPGHARVMCFERGNAKPISSLDLPVAQFAGQAAPLISDDLEVAFAAGTFLYVMDCKTGKQLWSQDRGYVSTSLAFSVDGKYIATSFMSLQIFARNADRSYSLYMDAAFGPSGEMWIGAQTAFSLDGKLAAGLYDARTAKQNYLQVWDLAAKNVTFSYKYKPVAFQQFQDVPSGLAFSEDGKRLVMGSWGDANKTNPTVNVFCLVCGKLLTSMTTPGSVFAVAAAGLSNGVRVLAGGKHVHANTFGSGGDLYAFEYLFTEDDLSCMSEDIKNMVDFSAPVVNQEEIDKINALGLSWIAGENERFAGMSFKEAERLLGTIVDREQIAGAGIPVTREEFDLMMKRPARRPVDTKALPASYLVSDHFPTCVNVVRDQQSCGSCYAFSSAETLSARYCIAEAKKGVNVSATAMRSPEEIVSCDKNDFGCGGGFLYFSWEFMATQGLVSETCFPYGAGSGSAPACVSSCASTSEKWDPIRIANSTLQMYGSEEEIMEALVNGGPVSVAFNVYASFFQYKSGVYKHIPGEGFVGGHAVMIIGYGVDAASGQKYWLVRNSWGESWGLQGNFMIERGTNECGIEYNSIWGDAEL